jgi:peroxiredoxin
MPRIELNATAPDFTLTDADGIPVSLSSFRDRRHVVLVFNRGFT